MKTSKAAAFGAALLMVAVSACGSGTEDGGSSVTSQSTESTASAGVEGESTNIVFWHVYSGPEQEAIAEMVTRFEADHPSIMVDAQFVGGYGDMAQKVAAALQAGEPPNVAIAYENNVIEYARSGSVLDLGQFLSTEAGADTNVEDFVPVELARNTYTMADDAHLSFPWTAAVGVMFYNEDMLASAGIDAPAATWDEFDTQCAAIQAELSKSCYAVAVDASLFNAVGFTFGGRTMDVEAGTTGYGDDAWTQTIALHADWIEKGYAYPTIGRADVATADISDFASQTVPYIIKSSRFLPFLQEAVGDSFAWSAAPLPQPESTDDPITVLFGPNVMAFDVDEAENLAAFEFIDYMTGPEGQAYWAEVSGNLPTRLSTADQPEYAAYLEETPAMRVAFDLLPSSVFEGTLGDDGLIAPMPNQLRTVVQDVEAELLTGAISPEEAQQTLTQQGDPMVAEYLGTLDG